MGNFPLEINELEENHLYTIRVFSGNPSDGYEQSGAEVFGVPLAPVRDLAAHVIGKNVVVLKWDHSYRDHVKYIAQRKFADGDWELCMDDLTSERQITFDDFQEGLWELRVFTCGEYGGENMGASVVVRV
eukprot:c4690_g1_i1.p2 GENE.c4690_g1_i1~~c4690_g1_i1.p2  ORF type:complete len:130 (-),score=54.42 c4690_g1_i1:39-428(-)